MSTLFPELTMKPPHSGHPLQWTPLTNGLFSGERMKLRSNSHNKTSMQRTLYSQHLSTVVIIFCSQITLPPRTDFSIAEMSNIRHFQKEMCIHFTFDNVLQFCLSFLRYLLFYFLSSFLFYFLTRLFQVHENVGISSQYSSLWLTCVSLAKMSKAVGQRQKYGCNNGNFCCIWTTTSSLQ